MVDLGRCLNEAALLMGMLPSLKQTLQVCGGGGRRTVTPGEGGFGPVGCPSRTPQSPGEQGGFPGTVSGVEALRLLPRLHAREHSWLLCPGRWLTPLSLPGDWRPPCPGHQTPGFTPHSWLGASGRGRAGAPPPQRGRGGKPWGVWQQRRSGGDTQAETAWAW